MTTQKCVSTIDHTQKQKNSNKGTNLKKIEKHTIFFNFLSFEIIY